MKAISLIIAGALTPYWSHWRELLPQLVGGRDEVILVVNPREASTLNVETIPGVRVVPLAKQVSLGVAWQAGVDAAKHEQVVLCPTYQRDPKTALAMLRANTLAEAAVCHGVPPAPTEEDLAQWLTTTLAEYVTGQPQPHPTAGLVLTSKTALQQYAIRAEELRYAAVVAAARGAKVHTQALPPALGPDLLSAASPRLTWATRWDRAVMSYIEALDFTLVMAWTLFKRNPLRGFGAPAFALGLVGLGLFFCGILTLLAGVFAPTLWVLVGVVLVLALLLLALAVVGEAAKRLYWPTVPAYLAPTAPPVKAE